MVVRAQDWWHGDCFNLVPALGVAAWLHRKSPVFGKNRRGLGAGFDCGSLFTANRVCQKQYCHGKSRRSDTHPTRVDAKGDIP